MQEHENDLLDDQSRKTQFLHEVFFKEKLAEYVNLIIRKKAVEGERELAAIANA